VAIPVFRNSATATIDNEATKQLACNLPSGAVAGDLLIAAVVVNNALSVINPPSGWTPIDTNNTANGSQHSSGLYYKFMQTGETGPYTFGITTTLATPTQPALYTLMIRL
jgi:hypothetical protein